MKLLLEEYKYPVELVREVLHGIGSDALQDIEGDVSLSYVGYFYNPQLRDCVFILPKVLMDESGKVFGKYDPKALIDLDKKENALTQEERKFIYEFAVWIHRAISVFQQSHKQSDIIYHRQISQVGHGMRRRSNTLLDILLSLIQFNKDHQDFITFILKNIHSGYNKINWTRTINRSQAIIQDNSPIYLNPVNKKRQINFDEELLIIYYSILNYISEAYGFQVKINVGFPLIKGAQFASYMAGRGRIRLRQIKYKYYSDLALELWDLCYAFFDNAEKIHITADLKEYLLVKNFYIVFEAIIDELIGSSVDKAALPKELTEQKDGKLVDHLYTYKGLMQPEGEETQTYYIGDSKYYRIGGHLGEHSIYKQYTYARNIIQYNIDLWLNDNVTEKPEIKVRDDQTEGYNILPNFFISAAMEKDDFSYSHREIKLTPMKDNPTVQYQFEDRLFDRDTLLLSRYNVNFLFVIALYARNKQSEKAVWKDEVRREFRKNIQSVLDQHYQFYPMRSKGVNPNEYVQTHFKQLIGKVFTPFEDKEILTLALQTPNDIENPEMRAQVETKHAQLLAMLEKDFTIQNNYKLGQQPQLPPRAAIQCSSTDFVLVGYYKNFEHLAWIKTKKLYTIRLGDAKGSMSINPELLSTKYLLLHGEKGVSLLELETEGPKIKSKADLITNHQYPSKDMEGTQYYLVFKIKGSKIQNNVLVEHGFEIDTLWDKLGIEHKSGLASRTLIPHITTIPQVMDCLTTPIEEIGE
ncbi:MAG: restriction endonuclease [Paludibacteraceae bacterium]|nr:restriction endonuclease [Paludibacteraceae bacterium]